MPREPRSARSALQAAEHLPELHAARAQLRLDGRHFAVRGDDKARREGVHVELLQDLPPASVFSCEAGAKST